MHFTTQNPTRMRIEDIYRLIRYPDTNEMWLYSSWYRHFYCESLWEQEWGAIHFEASPREWIRGYQQALLDHFLLYIVGRFVCCVKNAPGQPSSQRTTKPERRADHPRSRRCRAKRGKTMQTGMRKYLPKWGNIIQIGHYALIIRFVRLSSSLRLGSPCSVLSGHPAAGMPHWSRESHL